jgi:hypothetical protein
VINGNVGGRLDFKITQTGACSGSVWLGRIKYPFKGSVRTDLTGALRPRVHIAVSRPGSKPAPPPFQLSFDLVPQVGVLDLGGNLALGAESADIEGWRQTWHARNAPASSRAAYHTLVFELDAEHLSQPEIPQGNGFGSFTVSSAGTLKFTGKLADGTALTQTTFMGPDGQFGLFQTLYGKTVPGSLLGRIDIALGSDLDGAADNRLSGDLTWSRPAAGGQTYADGFDPVSLKAIGGAFTEPPLLLDVTPLLRNVRLQFLEAEISESVTDPDFLFTVGLNNRLTLLPAENPANATFKPIPSKGLFSGSFSLVDAHWDKPAPAMWPRKSAYQGIIIQTEEGYKGFGYFLLPALPEVDPRTTPPDLLSGQVIFQKAQ